MITVKRFWTFRYDSYYPQGGMYDCENSFDTLEEAIESLKNIDIILAHNEVWDMEKFFANPKKPALVWKNGAHVA